MRSGLVILLLSALILSACGGTTPPTSTPPPPAAATVVPTLRVTPTVSPLEILAETAAVPVPGTLEVPGGLGVERAFNFGQINFMQTQVQSSASLSVIVRSDGTVTRDGVVSQATPEQIAELNRLLGEMNFFAMQGQFTSADPGSSTFSYSLTIDADQGSRTIYAHDSLTPPQLRQLFDTLRVLGT